MNKGHFFVGAGLYAVALGAHALLLGPARGPVLLGAPIDITVQVQPDAGQDLTSSCISARLHDGDMPIGEAQVRITPLPEMRGQPSAVRVQAFTVVREPVLTMTMQVGCTGATVRDYTFLTELPTSAQVGGAALAPQVARSSALAQASREVLKKEALPPAPPAAEKPEAAGSTQVSEAAGTPELVAAPPAPAAALPVPVPPRNLAPTPAPQKIRPAPPKKPLPPKPGKPPEPAKTPSAPASQVPAPASPKAPEPPAPAAQESAPRLVMEPLKLLEQALAQSRLPGTAEQLTEAQRAQVLALWRALSTNPAPVPSPGPEANANADLVEPLQAQIAQLKQQTEQDKDNVRQLRNRLEALEEHESATSLWLYSLGAVVVFLLGVIAWLWQRLQRKQLQQERHWRDSVAQVVSRDKQMEEHLLIEHPEDTWKEEKSTLVFPHSESDHKTLPDTVPLPVAAATTATAPTAPAPLTMPAPVSPTAAAMAAAAVPSGSVASPSPSAAEQRVINVQELFDILEQAEFFISVGEHDEAIGVLQAHIADRGKSSPLSYLELLRLFHQLGRIEDFGRLREQFLAHFNAHVPTFAQFSQQGRTLDHYTDALADIEEQWTSVSTVPLIEGYLFCTDGQNPRCERFDLAAFDDLLLLLGIAQTTPASARGAPAPRIRTTPLMPPKDGPELKMPDPQHPTAALEETAAPAVGRAPLQALDFNFDDFDFAAPTAPVAPAPAPAPAPASAPASSLPDLQALEVDFDLNSIFGAAAPPVEAPMPRLVELDLPPLPVTPAPEPGQVIGFGMGDDKFELRFELEQQAKKGG